MKVWLQLNKKKPQKYNSEKFKNQKLVKNGRIQHPKL